MTETISIWGPPGCGKTTAAIGRVGDLHEAGVGPDELAFSSFTRRARSVARERVRARFGFDRDELAHYKTLHAHAYAQLGLGRDRVLRPAHLAEFAKAHRYDLTAKGAEVDREEWEVEEKVVERMDDHMLAIHEWARNRLLSLDVAFAQYRRMHDSAEIPPFGSVERFAGRYEAFKTERDLFDFTDMLTAALRTHAWPAVRWLVVDEFQDCSPLQVAYVRAWAATCEGLILAGDPDQAIYTFMGAAPELMAAFPGERVELRQSYRLPARVHRHALAVRARMRQHSGVEYAPTEADGRVDGGEWGIFRWHDWLDGYDSVAILARTNYLADRWVRQLIDDGIPFRRLKGPSPLGERSANLAVYRVVRKLERGDRPTFAEWGGLLEYVPVRGDRLMESGTRDRVKKAILGGAGDAHAAPRDLAVFGVLPDFEDAVARRDWPRLLKTGRVDHELLRYFARVEKRWGVDALEETPKVAVGTIHAYKGDEADHVLIDTGTSKRAQRAAFQDPDPELRVGYVAFTRARDRLTLIWGNEHRQAEWAA